MLRQRKQLPDDSLQRLQQILFNKEFVAKWRSQYIEWRQTECEGEARQIILDYLQIYYNIEPRNVILHNMVYGKTHVDNLAKTVYVFVIKGSPDAYLHEDGRQKQLLNGSVFTINDYIPHGVFQKENVDKEEWDELLLITADRATM
jgi:hypothetical protein